MNFFFFFYIQTVEPSLGKQCPRPDTNCNAVLFLTPTCQSSHPAGPAGLAAAAVLPRLASRLTEHKCIVMTECHRRLSKKSGTGSMQCGNMAWGALVGARPRIYLDWGSCELVSYVTRFEALNGYDDKVDLYQIYQWKKDDG